MRAAGKGLLGLFPALARMFFQARKAGRREAVLCTALHRPLLARETEAPITEGPPLFPAELLEPEGPGPSQSDWVERLAGGRERGGARQVALGSPTRGDRRNRRTGMTYRRAGSARSLAGSGHARWCAARFLPASLPASAGGLVWILLQRITCGAGQEF